MKQAEGRRGTAINVALRAPGAAIIAAIGAYRYVFSGILGRNCRFEPTCSAYAIEAIRTHGLLAGLFLIAWRILRCNPLCHGGADPVPRPSTADGQWHSGTEHCFRMSERR
ncbi:MAG: membrane protein insertion efficiency factor YidD [bacterium]|nr:membrane protein insertion efficiency factor YidD [bacterium]